MKIQTNEDKITVKLKEKNIECIIKYPKQSRLKTRLKILDKFKESWFGGLRC